MDDHYIGRQHFSKCERPSVHLKLRLILIFFFVFCVHIIESVPHGRDIQVRLYFQKDVLDLNQLQNVTFSSHTEAASHSDRDIDYDKVSMSQCDGTTEMDCFAVRLSPSIELQGFESVLYAKYYNSFHFKEEYSHFVFHGDYFQRGLQGISDEMLSKLVKVEALQIHMVDDAAVNDTNITYLYEEPYTLNLYLPMISFLVVNSLALLVGLFLLVSNQCEERRDDILERHRENQDRIIRDATLETVEIDSIESQIERHNINGLVLSLDASNDEGIELELTE